MRTEKRYEYNLAPLPSEELSRHQYHPNQQDTLKAMSPVNHRTQLNKSFENRYKQTLPYQPSSSYASQIAARTQQLNQCAAVPQNSMKSRPQNKNQENKNLNLSIQQGRLVSRSMKSYHRESNLILPEQERCPKNIQNRYPISQKIAPDTCKPAQLQQNYNFENIRLSHPQKPNKNSRPEHFLKDLNQKELAEKITRITHLNGEIKNRLERMLSKIEGLE